MPAEIFENAEVYIYTYNSVKKYVLVYGSGGIDGFYEETYTTTAIPDDMDWGKLAQDVDQQEKGEEPIKMRTKFMKRLLEAEMKVQDEYGDDIENLHETLAKSAEEYIPDYWHKVALEMKACYTKEEIKKYGYAAWDVMDKWVDKLISEID